MDNSETTKAENELEGLNSAFPFVANFGNFSAGLFRNYGGRIESCGDMGQYDFEYPENSPVIFFYHDGEPRMVARLLYDDSLEQYELTRWKNGWEKKEICTLEEANDFYQVEVIEANRSYLSSAVSSLF